VVVKKKKRRRRRRRRRNKEATIFEENSSLTYLQTGLKEKGTCDLQVASTERE
jgi:hypothetical protein